MSICEMAITILLAILVFDPALLKKVVDRNQL